MGLERVCAAADLAAGDMAAFYVEGEEVLVVRDKSGALHALNGICPHEDFPLVHGVFDGTTLTCVNHLWCFDVTTGRGVNPPSSRLAKYAIKVEDDDVYVDPDEEVTP
jgi:toluene monooxygenase system ferredoxin subunit